MTEDEAKTKWCPMVRYGVADDGKCSTNRSPEVWGPQHGATSRVNAHCIGSQCMAWRLMPKLEDPASGIKMIPDGGYCGLAGEQ